MGLFMVELQTLYTLSVQINLNFVILDDPICIYKVTSELVSSTLCSLQFLYLTRTIGLLKVCSENSINHV